eukprot:219228_1
MDVLDIAGLIFIAFNYAILCPLLLFCTYLFHKIDKSHPILKYRDKSLVYTLNAMMLVTLLIERVYANCVSVWTFINMSPNWMFYLLFSISWWSAFFLFAVKVFQLYYKQQYVIASQDIIWKKEINPNIANENWFIKNKHTYGNGNYCLKISFILFSISCLINTSVSYLFSEGVILDFTQYVLASIPILFSLVMCYKSRNIKDVYHIRNEISCQCVIIMLALFIYLCTFLYYKLTSPHSQITAMRMEWLFRNLVAQLCAIGLALISTIYPIYLVSEYDYNIQTDIKQQIDTTSDKNNNNLSNSRNAFVYKNKNLCTIKHIISNYDSYKAFMQYLTSEFALESLLYLTELIMTKHQIYKNKNEIPFQYITVRKTQVAPGAIEIDLCSKPRNDAIGNNDIYCYFYNKDGVIKEKLNISSQIPISAIVKNNENNLETQMKMLYNKYIKSSAQHELNLSSKVRRTLYYIFEKNNTYNKNNKYELFNIMDVAAMEILSLMSDPFRRFLKSELFKLSFVKHQCNIQIKDNNKTDNIDHMMKTVTPHSPLLLYNSVSTVNNSSVAAFESIAAVIKQNESRNNQIKKVHLTEINQSVN